MDEKTKICIIGGGTIGNQLLTLFSQSDLVEVMFVLDKNKQAPAMQAARKLGIKLHSEIDNILKSTPLDFIVETTGLDEVLEKVAKNRNRSSIILPSRLALLFFNILNERRGEMTQALNTDLNDLQAKIGNNTRDGSKALAEMERISNELEVLAINAGIQASRAGAFGKGFSVVAGEVKNTARVTRRLAGDLDQVINEIASMSKNIDQAMQKAQ